MMPVAAAWTRRMSLPVRNTTQSQDAASSATCAASTVQRSTCSDNERRWSKLNPSLGDEMKTRPKVVTE